MKIRPYEAIQKKIVAEQTFKCHTPLQSLFYIQCSLKMLGILFNLAVSIP